MLDRSKPAPKDRLIGAKETAARLNWHIVTLYKKTKSDPRFRPVRGLGKRLKFRESTIDAIIADDAE
jgi:hypothetical protein